MPGRDDRVDPILEFLASRDPEASLDAKAVTMRLRRAAHWVDVQVARSLAPLGIELWELDVLATLTRLGGTAPIAVLQDAAQLTAGAITHRIIKLESSGFVTRAADPVDRRQVHVTLTRTGRTRARTVVTANDRAQREALAGVDDVILRRLARDLRSFLVSTEGTGEDG